MASVIGIIRFSLLTTEPARSWVLTRDTESGVDAHARALFLDERLAARFALFESVTLPSLDAQNNKNFRIFVLTSSCLPIKWRERIEDLERQRDYMSVFFLPPMKTHSHAAWHALSSSIDTSVPYITFRIDDDDALSKDFISKMISALSDVEGDAIFTSKNGLYVAPDTHGEGFLVGNKSYPAIGIGLAYKSSGAGKKSIFHLGNHYNIKNRNDLIIDESELSWIRSVYVGSDSQSAGRGLMKKHFPKGGVIRMNMEETAALLRNDYPSLSAKDFLAALNAASFSVRERAGIG